MRRIPLLGQLLNSADDLKRIEELRVAHLNDQIAFINAVSGYFDCLEKIFPPYKKILVLFATHGTELPFKTIFIHSRLARNTAAMHLTRLEEDGVLEKNERGDWKLKNKDFLRHLIFKYSKFSTWLEKKNKETSGDIIDKYIAAMNKEYAPELDKFRQKNS